MQMPYLRDNGLEFMGMYRVPVRGEWGAAMTLRLPTVTGMMLAITLSGCGSPMQVSVWRPGHAVAAAVVPSLPDGQTASVIHGEVLFGNRPVSGATITVNLPAQDFRQLPVTGSVTDGQGQFVLTLDEPVPLDTLLVFTAHRDEVELYRIVTAGDYVQPGFKMAAVERPRVRITDFTSFSAKVIGPALTSLFLAGPTSEALKSAMATLASLEAGFAQAGAQSRDARVQGALAAMHAHPSAGAIQRAVELLVAHGEVRAQLQEAVGAIQQMTLSSLKANQLPLVMADWQFAGLVVPAPAGTKRPDPASMAAVSAMQRALKNANAVAAGSGGGAGGSNGDGPPPSDPPEDEVLLTGTTTLIPPPNTRAPKEDGLKPIGR